MFLCVMSSDSGFNFLGTVRYFSIFEGKTIVLTFERGRAIQTIFDVVLMFSSHIQSP
jgi:hypothetical protein